MWQRPALVLLYLLLVVLTSWILEWTLWLENGYVSYQILDPLHNLSVVQMRMLLESRGIPYVTPVEKYEIIDALRQSGPSQLAELVGSSHKCESLQPIEISRKDEYYEQVNDGGEVLWLLEIVPGEGQYAGHRLLDDNVWRALASKVCNYGIKTAVVLCHYDRRFCAHNGWSQPQLVLLIPSVNQEANSKMPVISSKNPRLPSMTHLSSTAVLNWLHSKLSHATNNVMSLGDLKSKWLNTTVVEKNKVPHILYISELLSPPLLLATLGLRFSSRIKLAFFSVSKEDKEQVSALLRKYKLNSPPSLVVVTSKNVASYGSRRGEAFTNSALDLYVRLLHPKMNDVFLISLILANLLAVVDIFDVQGRAWKHLLRTVFRIPVYNITVFMLWLAVTALMQFSWVNTLVEYTAALVERVCVATVIHFLLYQWLLIEQYPCIIVISVALFGLLVLVWRKVIHTRDAENLTAEIDRWWTVFPMDSYLFNVLFRPMASLSRPRPSNDLGLEEGMELLIERLATPELWLYPVVSTDYIKDLPIWRYDGWGNEEDLKSESDTEFDSVSETESDNMLHYHACCDDVACRLCELWTSLKEVCVCHRCAMLKRKLEKQYLRYKQSDDVAHQNTTYEKLIRVCENCIRTRQQASGDQDAINGNSSRGYSQRHWLLSPQRLKELGWTAPSYAIESRICAICLGRYRWSSVLCGLPCGHTYHHSCITEWLLKDNHHCPTCRWASYKKKQTSYHSHYE